MRGSSSFLDAPAPSRGGQDLQPALWPGPPGFSSERFHGSAPLLHLDFPVKLIVMK